MAHRTSRGYWRGKNWYAAFGGPRAESGLVLSEQAVEIIFSSCVQYADMTGITVTVDGVEQVPTSAAGSENVLVFSGLTITPGDVVVWAYAGGTDSIVSCDKGEDIGPWTVSCVNPLVLSGDLLLLETGGRDIIRLEDDVTNTDGINTEDAP